MTEGEIGAVLSILNAYKDDGTKKQQPWHITEAGWRIYLMHPNSQIQKAAWQHPECPAKIVAEIHSLIKELEWQTA